MKYCDKKNNILKIILGLIVVMVCVQHIFDIYQPTLLDDEYCYWSIAAYLNNTDWSSVTSYCSYYSYGYSFILFIIMKVFSDTIMMYRAAVVINAFLMFGSFIILDRILCKIFCNADRNKCTIAAFLSIMIPCNINYASVNLTECLLLFLTLVLAWFVITTDRDESYIRIFAAAVVSGYAYMVHQRMLCVIVAIVVTLVVMTFDGRYKIAELITYIAGVTVMLLLHSGLKNHFKQAVWLGKNAGAGNDYGSITSNIKYIFSSFNNFARFIVGVIGKIYYYMSATYLVGGIALVVMIISIYKCYKKNNLYIFVICSFVMLWGLASVFMAKLGSGGLSPLLYGRYMEIVYPLILAIGIMCLSSIGSTISLKRKLSIIVASIAVYGTIGLVVRMYIKRRELRVINYISCGQIYKYMSGDNLPVLKMMFIVSMTFVALMFITEIRKYRKVTGVVLATAVFICELRTAYIPFNAINLWLQDNKKQAKEVINVLNDSDGRIYYYMSDEEDKQTAQNREYIQYWLKDRKIICINDSKLDKIQFGEHDVVVVSSKEKNAELTDEAIGKYKRIYEDKEFVSVYKIQKSANI